MLDTKVTKTGTLLIHDGKIMIEGFSAPNCMCREVAAHACLWAIGVLQKELTCLIDHPGGDTSSIDLPADVRKALGKSHHFEIAKKGKCADCGCTDDDCTQCVERTGQPCYWANEEKTLCSSCAQRRRGGIETPIQRAIETMIIASEHIQRGLRPLTLIKNSIESLEALEQNAVGKITVTSPDLPPVFQHYNKCQPGSYELFMSPPELTLPDGWRVYKSELPNNLTIVRDYPYEPDETEISSNTTDPVEQLLFSILSTTLSPEQQGGDA